MPHAAEQQRAMLLLAKQKKLNAPQVPGYMVEGLTLTKRGKQVRPLFLSKRDCDAAVEALAAKGEAAPKVVVYDALGVLSSLAESIDLGDAAVEADLNSLEIVPPTESLSFREELKGSKAKRPAKVVPPDPRGPF